MLFTTDAVGSELLLGSSKNNFAFSKPQRSISRVSLEYWTKLTFENSRFCNRNFITFYNLIPQFWKIITDEGVIGGWGGKLAPVSDSPAHQEPKILLKLLHQFSRGKYPHFVTITVAV
jgi:hypothetical protein